MITFTKECDLANFNFWSGARYVAKSISSRSNANDCWAYLEAIINNSGEHALFTETDINDFVWFDAEDILIENGLIED